MRCHPDCRRCHTCRVEFLDDDRERPAASLATFRRDQLFGAERAARMDPAADCVRLGLPFTIHTDAPCSNIGTLQLVQAAVTRKCSVDGSVVGPEQAVSLTDALRAVTIHAAGQIGMVDQLGTLECWQTRRPDNPRTGSLQGRSGCSDEDQGERDLGRRSEKVRVAPSEMSLRARAAAQLGRIAPVGRTAGNGRRGGVPARRRKPGRRPKRTFHQAPAGTLSEVC